MQIPRWQPDYQLGEVIMILEKDVSYIPTESLLKDKSVRITGPYISSSLISVKKCFLLPRYTGEFVFAHMTTTTNT